MTLIIVVVVAVLLYVIMAYNGMIKLKNQAKEAWSDIDVQLKRRYNLIPNIVETVKGYAAHEEGVMTKVTEARANAINAGNIKDQGAAENMLAGALKSLFAVAENYPDLKANENFMQLQNELVDTEDKIQSSRRFYNGVVRDFNTKIQQFPAKLVAQMFQFRDEEFFEVEDEEQKEVVEVSFNKEGTRQEEKEEKKEEKAEEPKAEDEEPEKKEEEKPDEEPEEEKAKEEEAPEEEKPAKEEKEEEPKEEEEKEEEGPTEEAKKEESKEDEPAEESKEGTSEQTEMPLEHDDEEKKD